GAATTDGTARLLPELGQQGRSARRRRPDSYCSEGARLAVRAISSSAHSNRSVALCEVIRLRPHAWARPAPCCTIPARRPPCGRVGAYRRPALFAFMTQWVWTKPGLRLPSRLPLRSRERSVFDRARTSAT